MSVDDILWDSDGRLRPGIDNLVKTPLLLVDETVSVDGAPVQGILDEFHLRFVSFCCDSYCQVLWSTKCDEDNSKTWSRIENWTSNNFKLSKV